MIEIIIYSIIAVFIAWIWVDFYRLIDVFHREKLIHFIIMFLLGACSVYIVFAVHNLAGEHYPQLNGEIVHDFLFCTFGIGLLEEVAKTTPFVVFYLVFKRQFDEPIDFLAYISISALGFSATENVLYFVNKGPELIIGRSILSTVGHMFDTSLIAYGVILIKYHPIWRNKGVGIKIFILLAGLLAASLSHGIYDFWLLLKVIKPWGWIITIIYFLISINLFAIILNNSLNNSPHFTYRKHILSWQVSKRLLFYYLLVFAIEFLFLWWVRGIEFAWIDILISFWTSGMIVLITVLRISNFTLVRARWSTLKLQFPIQLGAQNTRWSRRGILSIRGRVHDDNHLHLFLEVHARIYPMQSKYSYMKGGSKIYIEDKLFLAKDEAVFSARLYDSDGLQYQMIHLKARTYGQSFVNDKYPLVAILRWNGDAVEDWNNYHPEDFYFQEWAYLVPEKQS